MTNYQVLVTEPAARDLHGVADYIANDLHEPETARRQLGRLKEAVLSLGEYPTRCSLVAEPLLARQGFRKMVVDNYLVFYIVSDQLSTVTVIRVLYNRRDWASLL